jgi:hypothetical protein
VVIGDLKSKMDLNIVLMHRNSQEGQLARIIKQLMPSS